MEKKNWRRGRVEPDERGEEDEIIGRGEQEERKGEYLRKEDSFKMKREEKEVKRRRRCERGGGEVKKEENTG